ncbi:hypothetical protein AKO1_007719, partial [Acrasis kona]
MIENEVLKNNVNKAEKQIQELSEQNRRSMDGLELVRSRSRFEQHEIDQLQNSNKRLLEGNKLLVERIQHLTSKLSEVDLRNKQYKQEIDLVHSQNNLDVKTLQSKIESLMQREACLKEELDQSWLLNEELMQELEEGTTIKPTKANKKASQTVPSTDPGFDTIDVCIDTMMERLQQINQQ